MKHFLGGWALGFLIALALLPSIKPGQSIEQSLWAHIIVAVLFGLAAWGILP